jgi:hypothetical protein
MRIAFAPSESTRGPGLFADHRLIFCILLDYAQPKVQGTLGQISSLRRNFDWCFDAGRRPWRGMATGSRCVVLPRECAGSVPKKCGKVPKRVFWGSF